MKELTDPGDLREGALVRLKPKESFLSSFTDHVVKLIKIDGDYAIIEFVKTVTMTGSVGYKTEIYLPNYTFSIPSDEYLKEFVIAEWPENLES